MEVRVVFISQVVQVRYRYKLLSAQCLACRKFVNHDSYYYIIFWGKVARSLLIGLLGEGKPGKG